MENIVSFLNGEKRRTEENINKFNDKISQCHFKIEEIEKLKEEISNNIDNTFSVFTPNVYDKDKNEIEIEKLNAKKKEYLNRIQELEKRVENLENKIVKIDEAFEDVENTELQLAESIKGTKKTVSKEVKKTKEENYNEFINILEYEINKCDKYFSNDIEKEISKLSDKISLCNSFVNVDQERTKVELLKLEENINALNRKFNTKMFHVKHFDGSVGIYKQIKDFIDVYNQKLDNKIEYSYNGFKISDSGNRVVNIIRIIKEAIENANTHGGCSKINVSVEIDNLIAENQVNDENNNDSTAEMRELNFIVQDINKFRVNVKISDNGEGFVKQKDNILIENNMYGIQMMKYRSKLINAKFNIESTVGLGTVVTLVYEF